MQYDKYIHSVFSSEMHLEAEQKLIKYDIKLHIGIKIHTVVDSVCEECEKSSRIQGKIF